MHDAGAMVMPAMPAFYFDPKTHRRSWSSNLPFACWRRSGLPQEKQYRWQGGRALTDKRELRLFSLGKLRLSIGSFLFNDGDLEEPNADGARDDHPFEHSVFALPFALVGALLAARASGTRWPGGWQIFWIVVAMVGARSAAMTMNRIADVDYDRRNPRTKMRALPAGQINGGICRRCSHALVMAVLVLSAWQLNLARSLSFSPVALAVVVSLFLHQAIHHRGPTSC